MRMKSMLTVGLLSMIAATAVVNASDSFASDTHRVDVIGTLHERVVQSDSVKPEGKLVRVDVIDTIHEKEGNGPEGPVYPYTKPMSR